MQIADLRCIQVSKGGIKYELMLSLQSTLDSNQAKSKFLNRTTLTSDLDRNRKAVECRSCNLNAKLMRPRTSCGGDMKKKQVKNSKAQKIKNIKNTEPHDKILAMAADM
ncbi:hypothetical protein NPIL_574941, partial [Nephila pilipes]